MAVLRIFDLEKQFTFYASYHNHPVNVAIHLICIWPILATAILMLQYTPALLPTPAFLSSLPLGADLTVNVALAVALVYIVSYVVMDPMAGSLAAALVGLLYVSSAKLVSTGAVVGGYPVWQVALAIHVAAWILQFVGHGYFEGRAPALLDSLDQAFLTAPLFVLLEVLFFFGYKKKLHDKIMKKVNENIKEFRDTKNQSKKYTNAKQKRK